MEIILDKRFTKKVVGRLEKYDFEVGILQDKAHKHAKYGTIRSFAGGPARKVGSTSSNNISDISKFFRKRTNYLRAPFERKSDAIIKLSREILKFALGRSEAKRVRNMMQAIVRNPILRRDYGPNSMATVKIKGFDRFGIDTGQFFKNILSRIVRKRRV
jgi:hypothetical protein